MSRVKFEVRQDWCGSEIHRRAPRPVNCVRIGAIVVCEDCLIAYVDGWDDSLTETFMVEEYHRDLIGAVRCATLLALGLEEA